MRLDCVCTMTVLFLFSLLISANADRKSCVRDSECKTYEACIIDECEDLRDYCDIPEYCGDLATCEIFQHEIICICKPGHQGTDEYPCIDLEPVTLVTPATTNILPAPNKNHQNKNCHTDSNCGRNGVCLVDECGDLTQLCDMPHYCGDNANCEVRNREVECVCKSGHQSTDEYPCKVERVCETTDDCHPEETCSFHKCENPCKYWICGENSTCKTTFHSTSCHCLPGLVKVDPKNSTSACREPKLIKSEELQVPIYGAGSYATTQDLSFSLLTHSLAVDLTELKVDINGKGNFTLTVEIETETTVTTLTHTGYCTDYWEVIPISAVVLSPSSWCNITISCDTQFDVWKQTKPVKKLEHLNLHFLQYGDKYGSPVSWIHYKTLTPQ